MDEENMDVWKDRVQQDLNDIKQRQQRNEGELSDIRSDVHKLQVSDQLQNQEINSLKETLSEIKSDTSWIRRKITGALITTVITAIVGGVIAFAISQVFY